MYCSLWNATYAENEQTEETGEINLAGLPMMDQQPGRRWVCFDHNRGGSREINARTVPPPPPPPHTHAHTHTHTCCVRTWGHVCRVFNTRNCDFNPLTGDHSDTIHTNRDFNQLTGDASYSLYTQLLFNVPAGSFLKYALNISDMSKMW